MELLQQAQTYAQPTNANEDDHSNGNCSTSESNTAPPRCRPEFLRSVSWTSNGKGFVVWEKEVFVREVLPAYFGKRISFSAFRRQLVGLGFRQEDLPAAERRRISQSSPAESDATIDTSTRMNATDRQTPTEPIMDEPKTQTTTNRVARLPNHRRRARWLRSTAERSSPKLFRHSLFQRDIPTAMKLITDSHKGTVAEHCHEATPVRKHLLRLARAQQQMLNGISPPSLRDEPFTGNEMFLSATVSSRHKQADRTTNFRRNLNGSLHLPFLRQIVPARNMVANDGEQLDSAHQYDP